MKDSIDNPTHKEKGKTMAKLISITETADAITAEASAYVWEEYDAPRKRVPRARIVEHRFTVSIPRYDYDAAPLAFVVEHFPKMVGRNAEEYRPGYDQPIRYADGKLYTPVRMDFRHRTGTASNYESSNPFERLGLQVLGVHAVDSYDRERYAEAIARDEIRADQYPACSDRAKYVEQQAEQIAHGLAVIDGEIWQECAEPVYEYSSNWFGRDHSSYILVNTDKHRHGSGTYGANDRAALAYYHADVRRYAYIRVLRPDLVTVDNTHASLQERSDRTAEKASELKAQIEALQIELEGAEKAAAEARADLDAYESNPRAWWSAKADEWEDNAKPDRPFTARRRRGIAALRREITREA